MVRRYYQLVFHPIPCDYCNYKAPWPNYMTRHILRYHKASQDFPCHLCTYKTRVRHDLTNHLRRQHKVFKNPHPRNDQIDNIEIISEDTRREQIYSDLVKRNQRVNNHSRLVASRDVDPETKRIIAEKIERANIELTELKENQN